jgi:hypothetical protein
MLRPLAADETDGMRQERRDRFDVEDASDRLGRPIARRETGSAGQDDQVRPAFVRAHPDGLGDPVALVRNRLARDDDVLDARVAQGLLAGRSASIVPLAAGDAVGDGDDRDADW